MRPPVKCVFHQKFSEYMQFLNAQHVNTQEPVITDYTPRIDRISAVIVKNVFETCLKTYILICILLQTFVRPLTTYAEKSTF